MAIRVKPLAALIKTKHTVHFPFIFSHQYTVLQNFMLLLCCASLSHDNIDNNRRRLVRVSQQRTVELYESSWFKPEIWPELVALKFLSVVKPAHSLLDDVHPPPLCYAFFPLVILSEVTRLVSPSIQTLHASTFCAFPVTYSLTIPAVKSITHKLIWVDTSLVR